MEKNDRIYVAGHTGLVGSALLQALERAADHLGAPETAKVLIEELTRIVEAPNTSARLKMRAAKTLTKMYEANTKRLVATVEALTKAEVDAA